MLSCGTGRKPQMRMPEEITRHEIHMQAVFTLPLCAEIGGAGRKQQGRSGHGSKAKTISHTKHTL